MLNRFEQKIKKIEVWLSITAIFFLLTASMVRLVLRNFGSAPWASNLTESLTMALPHGVLILAFLGASIGLTRGESIAIDAAIRFYPPSFKQMIMRLAAFIALVIASIFLYLAFGYAKIDNSIPVNYILIPGFVLICTKLVFRLVTPAAKEPLKRGAEQ